MSDLIDSISRCTASATVAALLETAASTLGFEVAGAGVLEDVGAGEVYAKSN